MPDKMRIDKWLWVVRIFKSRTQATEACKKSKVSIHETIIKASTLIEVGQIIDLYKDRFNLKFKVTKLIPNRVSAVLASECYLNLTPIEELNKFSEWQNSAFHSASSYQTESRPTKKERRDMEDFLKEV